MTLLTRCVSVRACVRACVRVCACVREGERKCGEKGKQKVTKDLDVLSLSLSLS